jgi:peroxiredoxin
MDRTSTFIVILAAIAGLAGFALGGWLSMTPSDTLREGTRYEDFELPALDGQMRRPSEFEGRVIVLNFWATWCPPCVRELPMLARVQREQEERGLTIIGIAEDDEASVRRFLERYPAGFLHLLNAPGRSDLGRRYGNLRSVLPYTVVIDRQGEIAWRRYGELNERELMRQLEPLLAAGLSR